MHPAILPLAILGMVAAASWGIFRAHHKSAMQAESLRLRTLLSGYFGINRPESYDAPPEKAAASVLKLLEGFTGTHVERLRKLALTCGRKKKLPDIIGLDSPHYDKIVMGIAEACTCFEKKGERIF